MTEGTINENVYLIIQTEYQFSDSLRTNAMEVLQPHGLLRKLLKKSGKNKIGITSIKVSLSDIQHTWYVTI